jgi:DNA end-binding protein Ku
MLRKTQAPRLNTGTGFAALAADSFVLLEIFVMAKSHRSSWRGYLKIDLVAFQVQAFNAAERDRGEIHFHQLHKDCHKRIRYEKVCPVHGQVSSDEIVSGYEYAKNKYIEVDPEELDTLRTKHEKALTIDTFISPDEFDEIYYDGRNYYLSPMGKEGNEPYALVYEAMERMNRYAIGQIVLAGRDQLVLIRPYNGLLLMSMLNYANQVRDVGDMKLKLSKPSPKKLLLAEKLIESATEDRFDFGDYEDAYERRIKELIEARIKGREVVAPQEEEEPEVINLMDALRQSVAKVREGRPHLVRAVAKRKAAPKRKTSKRGTRKRAS